VPAIERSDERYVLITDAVGGSTTYEFMLAPQNQGINSTSPFGQKTVTGERSLSDYDTESIIAFGDLSGGIGQERLVDPAMYQSGSNIDTRGGKTQLGPLIHTSNTNVLNSTFRSILSGATNFDAAWFSVDSDVQLLAVPISPGGEGVVGGYIDRVWLPLAISGEAEEVVITIRKTALNGTIHGICTYDRRDARPSGSWLECKAGVAMVLDPLYLVVQHRGPADAVRWFGGNVVGAATNGIRSRSTWMGQGTTAFSNAPPISSLRYHLLLTKLATQYVEVEANLDRIQGEIGVAACFDRSLTPRDGLIACHTGTHVRLYKWLAGVRTTLINVATAYVAHAPMKLMTYPDDETVGTGCTVNINAVDPVTGAVTGITLVDGGTDYTQNDEMEVIGGANPGYNCTITASTVVAGIVTAITLVAGGVDYTTTVGASDPTYISPDTVMWAKVYYNGAQISTARHITDASIYSETLHGLYSTSINYMEDVAIGTWVSPSIFTGISVEDAVWQHNTYEEMDAEEILVFAATTVSENTTAAGPDGPLTLVPGTGSDGIPRIWGFAGRYLYYLDADSVPVVVEDGLGDALRASADILDAAWFRPDGATYAELYLALGDDSPILSFNGNIGAEVWESHAGLTTDNPPEEYDLVASRLAVHDQFLWIINSRNQVSGSIDGVSFGDEIGVGDRVFEVSKLVSWNSALYAGKEDGIYKISYAEGANSVVRAVDLSSLTHPNNCAMMTVHQGDLYFSLITGMAKWTASGVLVPVAPEITLDAQLSSRGRYEAGATSMTALWAGNSGDLEKPSVLLAYVDGAWTSLATMTQLGDRITSMLVDPGWYGDTSRVYWSTPFGVHWVNMPLNTVRRWLGEDMDYPESGSFTTSWMDGNLSTVQKHWSRLETVTEGYDADAFYPGEISFEYRTDPDNDWTAMGSVSGNGFVTLDMPKIAGGIHSERLQLRVTITRNSNLAAIVTSSPRLLTLLVRYVERPDDAAGFSTSYSLSANEAWRTGAPTGKSLAQWFADLRILRQARIPLRYYPAWDPSNYYEVHMVSYDGSITVIDDTAQTDRFKAIVNVRLQLVGQPSTGQIFPLI